MTGEGRRRAIFYTTSAVVIFAAFFPFDLTGNVLERLVTAAVIALIAWLPASAVLYFSTRRVAVIPKWAFTLTVLGYVLILFALWLIIQGAG